MSSLADAPELVGFFSYSREDDADSLGALSALRSRIQGELRGQLGRTAKTFRLWQDKEAIPSGTLWESEIQNSAKQSAFFIPIITPTVVASPYCRFELEAFLAREAALGRSDLVFPLLYIHVPALEDSVRRENHAVLSLIAKRQYVDWRELRHLDANSTEVKKAVERFCNHIRDALNKPWLSPEERVAQEEAAVARRAEDDRKRQETETRRQEEEALKEAAAARERDRVDAERRQREEEAGRLRAEEARLRDEARAQRIAAQHQRQEQRRAEKEEHRRLRGLEAHPLWPPSRPTVIAASVVCLILIGAIGVWLAQSRAPTSPAGPIAAPVNPAPAPGRIAQAPAPVAPTPPAAAPVATTPPEPAPVAPVQSAPTPVVATPPEPAPVAPTRPAAAPVAPAPPAPVSVAPTPSTPAMPAPARRPVGSSLSQARERALKPGDTFQECEDCPVMVVVPTGSFIMGSPQAEPHHSPNESPQHTVTIGARFAVGRYAVTFDEWLACVDAGGCNHYTPDDKGWGRGRRPVINVSWADASAYVSWLSTRTGEPYRLLSEAEYEYAARAGTTTAYPWGDGIGRNNANCDGCRSQWDDRQTAPVGSFAANRFGLYDMVGNVWQQTEDCWNFGYDGAPTNGAAWTSGDCSRRITRGGSWFKFDYFLRSAARNWGGRSSEFGFRVARTLLSP